MSGIDWQQFAALVIAELGDPGSFGIDLEYRATHLRLRTPTGTITVGGSPHMHDPEELQRIASDIQEVFLEEDPGHSCPPCPGRPSHPLWPKLANDWPEWTCDEHGIRVPVGKLRG